MKKIKILNKILLLILFIRLLANGFLLLIIIISNDFLLIDFITVVAALLILISIYGIISKQKWGSEIAIIYSIYDLIIKFVIVSVEIFGLSLDIITIILAYLEYKQSGDYEEISLHNSVYQTILLQHSNRYCTNCGAILRGDFCQECGQKVLR